MVSKAVELMLADLQEKYDQIPSTRAFDRLYSDPQWARMFAVLHKRLNEHFEQINGRAETTHHYWAENSRDLIDLIKDIEQDLNTLRRAGVEVELDDAYQTAIERCRPWLSPSSGSKVPDDFGAIEVIAYEPVFHQMTTNVTLEKRPEPIPITMVGTGSYAHVYSYVDPDYGTKFALKRAKKDLDDRDLSRFRQEFAVLSKLKFPYVVEVYRYDDSRNEYRMEYCDTTLRDYIARNNNGMSFAARKRIALQFLYGINYLHFKNLLHRDISLQNILVKKFDDGAVLIKLSDFGLVKEKTHDFTLTSTEMKGTIRDPLLDSFKDYSVVNEIYAVGHILAYIFTGRERIPPATDVVGSIVHKCVTHQLDQRYQRVQDLIADVEQLAAKTGRPSA